MRNFPWFLVWLVAVMGFHATPAIAEPIFYDFQTLMGGGIGPTFMGNTFTAAMVFVDGETVDAVAAKRQEIRVGESLSLTPSDGQMFATAAALATNGLFDFIGWTFNWTAPADGSSATGVGTGGMRESQLFYGDRSGASGIDLAGIVINEFRLTLDAVYTDRPGIDLNHDGNWSDFAFLTTFEILGEGRPISMFPEPPRDLTDPLNPVPEPTTLVLVGTGLLGAIPTLRRNGRKRLSRT